MTILGNSRSPSFIPTCIEGSQSRLSRFLGPCGLRGRPSLIGRRIVVHIRRKLLSSTVLVGSERANNELDLEQLAEEHPIAHDGDGFSYSKGHCHQ